MPPLFDPAAEDLNLQNRQDSPARTALNAASDLSLIAP